MREKDDLLLLKHRCDVYHSMETLLLFLKTKYHFFVPVTNTGLQQSMKSCIYVLDQEANDKYMYVMSFEFFLKGYERYCKQRKPKTLVQWFTNTTK